MGRNRIRQHTLKGHSNLLPRSSLQPAPPSDRSRSRLSQPQPHPPARPRPSQPPQHYQRRHQPPQPSSSALFAPDPTNSDKAIVFVECPHCTTLIEIAAVNCAIFRCGIFKRNGQQLPPHAPEAHCKAWAERGMINGCGKPFRYKNGRAVACGYI